MSQFTGMILTKKGRELQAKAEAGALLKFTKAKIGDGQIGSGQSLEDLADLVHPLRVLDISSVQAEGGLCRIRSSITNKGITQGFYVKELGMFAQDPDVGEILYAITTASAADYLPPEGGATTINNQFDIIVIIGNASQISATITPGGLVDQEQLAKLQGQVDSLAKSVIGSGVVTGLSFTHSGLTASYTAGSAYVSGVKFDLSAGTIQLNANQGQYIYLDIDGKVKSTTDQAAAQAKCLLWYFSTNATNVIVSTDRRTVIDSTQFVKQSEVSAGGASKIPRLDAQGKGAFSITGEAAGTQAKLDAHTSSADPHTQYAKKSGETFTGVVNMDGGGQLFNLKPGEVDHVYMAFYSDSKAPTKRSGYFGYPSQANTTLTIGNEMENGDVSLVPKGSGRILANDKSMAGVKELNFTSGTKISETTGQRTAINAESDRLDVISEDGNRFILRVEEGIAAIQFMNFDMLGINKTVRSLKDANGKFRQVDHFRIDGTTLFMRTTLNGTPDANGNYPSMTIKRYKNDGVTEALSVIMPLAYDGDGDYTSFG
ncbi:hypothetical protein HPY27_01525 [Brevibacillus sp. HB1.1]|uniref:hypothetical protein n=1 Tax=Brevibacillus sp. HB1.1 TaxID=2738808 RepID=UPI001576F920|nr:hypothetical protein [Brevibacillus sp. HB1.1]NTU28840.1 hypothetical protein [Brevibacillus sp. HB1.1]